MLFSLGVLLSSSVLHSGKNIVKCVLVNTVHKCPTCMRSFDFFHVPGSCHGMKFAPVAFLDLSQSSSTKPCSTVAPSDWKTWASLLLQQKVITLGLTLLHG